MNELLRARRGLEPSDRVAWRLGFAHRRIRTRLAAGLVSLVVGLPVAAQDIDVTVRVDPGTCEDTLTGRLFLMITPGGEPRTSFGYTYAYYFNDPRMPYPQLFGLDVEGQEPGEAAHFDGDTLGYPHASLHELPAGRYSVQALLHVYTRFERADGHTNWVPMDRGEGQQFHLSPGNLYSEVQRVALDPSDGISLDFTLDREIPPISLPPDTEFLRRVEIDSELASEFWGHEMGVRATVLLPPGYDEHPDVHYPVLYLHGHFFESPPFRWPEEVPRDARQARSGYFPNHRFRQAWLAGSLPRMIVVSFQHPTPYYDDSYFIDSANNGPWGRVLMEEVLPVLDEEFRTIPEGWARVMTGGSTGGWVSAALQILHPEDFGGAWSFCPDPLDFRELLNIDVYREASAFVPDGYTWVAPERPVSRTIEGMTRMTVRQFSQLTRVLGSRGRSGEVLDLWNALFGPVGEDGYSRPLWDHETGAIDHEVARHWREHGYDLRAHLEKHWSRIGPSLKGKLHFICGDMDDFYLNLAVYRMEEFLESTRAPPYEGSFLYGAREGHGLYGYRPWPDAILHTMAEHIRENAPEDADLTWCRD